MTELSNYLVEQILLGEETTEIKKTVVVYSGRFQPMHKGHYAVYQKLVKKFGKENVYIGTSNVTDNKKSPFNFKEKKRIATTMFDIPSAKFVQIKNPYKPTEILSKFDEKTTSYVAVISKKDADRLKPKYFIPYNDKMDKGFDEHGYVYIVPILGAGVSGTESRNGLTTGTPYTQKKFFKTRIYDKFNDGIFKLITSKLINGFEIQKESIEEWLLKEGTIGSTGQADDGPAAFYPTFDVFDSMSISRAKQIGYEVLDMVMTQEIDDYYEYPNYPNGPVKAVSYFPAGVIGKMTPNNQVDIYSAGAYSQWFTHVTREASLAGYTVLSTQLEKSASKELKKMAGDMAKADRDIEAEFELALNEVITLPIEIGDTLLMGKWKNKKVVVKTIGKDEHGMPTINGKKVVTFRFGKKGPNIFENIVELEETLTLREDLTSGFKNLGIDRKEMPQIESDELKNYIKFIKSKGISYELLQFPIEKLNLTQKEINKEKIEKLMSVNIHNLAKPVVISKGGYILDGHHRVLALYALDKNAKIPAVQINLGIRDLLKLSRDWDNVSFKNIHETEVITEAQNKLKLKIPANVKKVVKAFKKHGKKVYIVGGAVRDAILGKTPHDFDLTTDAKPHEMVDICIKEKLKYIDTDIIYGMLIIGGDEVVTFRKDIGGSRKLDGIDYTDIEGDVKRRDLTINALFYDIDRGEIVDLVGGIADLKKKLIRTVGKASDRFEEDHLRKLRAVRFTVKLGGMMEPETLLAIKKDPTLKDVSANRIRMEFMKCVESAKSTKIYLDLMEKLKFLELTFPGLKLHKPYVDTSDYIILMAILLQKNSTGNLETILNKINYTTPEIRDMKFLQSLIKFDPKDIIIAKKAQKVSSVTEKQIIEFGKLIGKDFKKFIKYIPSVKGNDAPKDIKGKEIGTWISNEERRRYLKEHKTLNEEIPVNPSITTFKQLFSKLPSELQKRIYALKHIGQNPDYHPEGNVLKHTIVVVTQALKHAPGDIDLALAAIFHDIGKDETAGINPKTGKATHYGHERVSANLVKKYANDIKKLGGNVDDIFHIVSEHMRMHKFDVMRLSKQRALQAHPNFGKLHKFATKMDIKGYHESVAEISEPDIITNEALAVKGNKIEKLITGKNLTFEGHKYSEIFFELLGIDNGSKLVKLRVIGPKKIFGKELNVKFQTLKRGPFLKTDTSNVFEMAKPDLKSVEDYADRVMSPEDIEFTRHFFQRVNDPRNKKEISTSELIGFFKRLSKHKKELKDFLSKYREIMIKDDKTKINIPFVKSSNKLIAKTIMRTANWTQHKTPELHFENLNEDRWQHPAEWRQLMKTVKSRTYYGPWKIKVHDTKTGKVIHQTEESMRDGLPIVFDIISKKYPKNKISIEDLSGKELYAESINEDISVTQYKEALINLKVAIEKGTNGMKSSDAIKLYYQNAMKLGISKKLIDNSTRLAVNRYNKKNFGIGGPTVKDAAVDGIKLVLGRLTESIINEDTKNFTPDVVPKSKTWYKLDTKQILQVGDDVVDLIQTAYKNTPLGSFVNSKGDLNQSKFWNAIDVDGSSDADAVIFGRPSPNGVKIQGFGHDGESKSKAEIIKRLLKILKTNGYWVEASDALEHVLYKAGAPFVKSEKVAQSIFPKSDLKMTGKKGQYTRKVDSGSVITETVFGKPKVSVKEDNNNEGFVLQDLEKKYDIELELWDTGKILQLDKIIVPKTDRVSGKGTKVMNTIISYADKHKKPIYLTPSKSYGATSVSRLTQFYKQFGFIPNKDSSISKASMVRNPNIKESIKNKVHETLDEDVKSLKLQKLKLLNKAFRMLSNSPVQLKVRKEIDAINKKLGIGESITDLVNDIDVQLESFILPEIKLTEGGKATGGAPIPGEYVMGMYDNIIKTLKKEFKIKESDAKPLGSTGKKPKGMMSGDIDIAVDGLVIGANFGLKFDEVQEFIYNKIKSKFKNVVNMKGLGIVSFLYPIPKSDEFGQVDIMLSDNLEFTNFIFHSPNFIKNESKYKGLFRNVLLFSIVKYMDTGDVDEYFEDGKDKGEVKRFTKFSIVQKKGLVKQLKSFEGKLGKAKSAKPVKGKDQIIETVPSEIVKFIFGDKYTIKDMNSFESIYGIFQSSDFKHKKYKSKIMDNFKNSILKAGFPLPTEIK